MNCAFKTYHPAHPPAAERLAGEARASLAARLERAALILSAGAARVARGELHGLSAPRDGGPSNFLRGWDILPAELIAEIDRALAAIVAYGPEGETYFGAHQDAIRPITPAHSETMRVMMGVLADAAVRPGDEVAWEDPENVNRAEQEDTAPYFFTGFVLVTDRNLAVIREARRRPRGTYAGVREVGGLPVVRLDLLRKWQDDD